MPRGAPPPVITPREPLTGFDPKRLEALRRAVETALDPVAIQFGLQPAKVGGAGVYKHGAAMGVFFGFASIPQEEKQE